jgi:AbrB family looped-hinge helix DNA binding protein
MGYTNRQHQGESMQIKVRSNGQIVIPARVREQLGFEIGALLEVEVVPGQGKLVLRRRRENRALTLGGSLKMYARGKVFPSKPQMKDAMRRGLDAIP